MRRNKICGCTYISCVKSDINCELIPDLKTNALLGRPREYHRFNQLISEVKQHS